MTVTTLNNKDFGTGDGVMTVFPFTFRLQQASDLKVYVSGALVLTGYTVAINASGVGGNVTFTAAPANLAPIVFVRLVTLTQSLSLPVEANFSEVDITNALDKLTMEVQQNAEAIGRSITLPITSSISGLTLPNPSALKVLRWNATADALENTDINVTGGGILGPGTSNANRPVLWNATNGSLVKNATNDNGTAGFVWTSNGPTAEPTFQAAAGGDYALQTTQSGTWANSNSITAADYPVDCTSASTLNLIAATGSRRKIRLFITTGTGLLTINRNGTDTIVNTTGSNVTQLLMRGAYGMFLELQDIVSGKWAII